MKHLKLIFACLLMAILSIGQMWATVTGSIASSIADGDQVILINKDANKEFTSISSNVGQKADYTTTPAGTCVLTVETGKSGTNTFSFKMSNGSYLAYTSTATSSSNYLYSVSDISTANAKKQVSWTVAFNDNNEATITNVYNTSRVLKYNSQSPRFCCYTSGQQLVKFFKLSGSQEPSLLLDPTSKEFEATGNSAQAIALTASNFASAVNSVTCAFFSNAECTSSISRPSWVNEPTVNNAKTQVSVNVEDNDGAARQTWMKITASDGSKNASAVFAISQKKYTEPTGMFNKFTGTTLTEGDYVLTYNTYTLANSLSSSRWTNGDAITKDVASLTNPDASVIWHLSKSGDYWLLYNADVEKYAAGTNTKNEGSMVNMPQGGASDMMKWTATYVATGTWDFENYGRSQANSNSGNKWLRNNGSNGWACYASGTNGALTLYKKALPTHKVTFTAAPTGGTVVVSVGGSSINTNADVEEGSTVTITPTPSTYYRLVSVTKGGQAITPVQGVYSFTMPTSDVAIAVTFEYIPVTNVTVAPASLTLVVGESSSPLSATVLPNNALGTVTWSSANSNIASVNSETGVVTAVAASENPVNIIATSTVTGTISGTCAVTVNAATGSPITILTATGGEVTASVDVADVLEGTQVTLTATPADGYSLSGWTVIDENANDITPTSQSGNTFIFNMPDGEVTVEASFTHEEAVLKLHDADGESTFDSENTHYWKESVTLPGTAAACSKTFMGWSADENRSTAPELAKGASYTIPNKGDNHLYAVYADVEEGESVEIKYSGSSTTNMTGNNDAATLGLDATDWSVIGAKGNNQNFPGLNKAGDIRLYYDAGGSNTITVTAPQTVSSISMTFNEGKENVLVQVGGNTVNANNGVYAINATSFVLGNANTSNVQVQIKTLTVTLASANPYSNYSTTCLQKSTTPILDDGGIFDAAKSVEIVAEDGATIYYTTDGSDPKTSDTKQTYSTAIELSERGTYTIKAYAVEDGKDASDIAEATYTINLPFATVGDLFSYLEENSLTELNDVIVTGVVTEIVTEYSSQHNNVSINIADDFDSNSPQLEGYRTKDATGVTAASVVAVGDKVTLKGNYTYYLSTTHQLSAGNTIEEYTAKELSSVTVGGTASKTAYSEEDNQFSFAGLTATANYNNTGYSKDVTNEVTWKANEEEIYTVAEGGDVNVTATLSDVTSEPKVVAVTYTTKTVESISLSYSAKTVYIGEECPEPVVTASYEEAIDPEDVTDLATFDKSAYVANTAGTYTINVSYQGKNASYDVTVKDYANDEEHPYTVADAKDIITNVIGPNTSERNIFVRGIVSEIVTAYSSQYHNITYNITDDGLTTSPYVQVYRGKGYNGANLSSADDIKVGDVVVVEGTVVYYNSATPQFTAGTGWTSLVRAGALTVNNVAEFEVGQPDLAEANLTINRHGSTGAITFSCDENDALKIVENGTKLRAKGEATADVTVTATMAADNTEGKINFTGASTTFTVHVIPAKVRYAVTFDLDGGSADPEMSLGGQLENANVVIPDGTFTKDGYKFNGWVVTYVDANEQVQNVTVTKNGDVYSFTMPAAAVTVTAQWAEGSDFTWDATAQSYTNQQDIATATAEADPISIVFAKETAQNGPKYYTNGTSVRTYAGNTVTIATKSDTKLINKITFTYGSNKDVAADGLSEDKLTWTGLAKTVVLTAGSGQAHFKTITVTYLNGTVTTLDIENVSLMLTAGTKDLSISCNVNPTPAISYEIAEEDQAIATVEDGVVTAKAVGGPINVTANIAQGSNYTAAVANFTITVTDKTPTQMSFSQASYDAYLGSDFEEPALTTDPEGIAVTYSSSVPGVATVDETTGVITLVGEGTTVITAAFAGNDDYSANSATYTLNVIDPYTDVLTNAKIGAGTSYTDWKKSFSLHGTTYAGNTTTGTSEKAGTIQMRTSSGSGIVSTSAIGYLKSVSATETQNGTNTLQIYAKSTAYESPADLHDANKRGTLIGTIGADGGAMVFETGKAYSDNYKYIGIKANGGGVNYDDITITWTPAVFASFDVTYQAGEGTGTDVEETIEEGSIISLAANTFTAPEGKMFAGWLLEGEENAREAGSKYTVTAAATFTAQWVQVYTITYLPGEAEGEPVVVENVPVGNYSLAANTFTAPESKEFAGWKLNNEGDVLAANSDFEVTANAEFTAQWSIVKQEADLEYETTSYMITRGRSFEAPELTNPHTLAVAYSGNNDAVATVDAATGAITLQGGIGTVTVTATSAETDYYYAGEASYTLKVKDANLSGGWVRLTNANTLVAGMKVIVAQHVASGTAIKTMGAQNDNNRAEVTGALEDGTLVADEGTEILTLVAIKNTTNFALKTTDNKYLYAASSSKNYLREQANIDDNATWSISLSEGGVATITAQGENTNKIIRYNNNNKLFSCYSSGQQDIAIYSKTVAVSGNTDASTLDEYADVVVADDATLVIDEGTKPLGNITGNVEVNAPLQAEGVHLGVNNTMTVNSTVNVPSFSISVKLGSTGEATNVTVSGSGNIAAPEGYVDMELSYDANPDQWHSFTVPFEVDALNGIYDAETGAKLTNEVNYAIMDYHGDIRANGKYGWKKYRGTLQPGVFYLITIDGNSKVLRFMKKEGSSYVAPNSMEMTYYGGQGYAGAPTDFGWCGVGNRNMFNGYVPQEYVAQVLNAAGTGYEPIDATQAMSACIPFFIQVNVTVNLVMATSAPDPNVGAPRRVAAKGIERMKVFFGNENYTDKLYISASEEATNEYEIGKDLLKMTMTNTPSVPQIFGNAYGNKLCMVYAPMSNDQAVYDLTLYAPANGEYTIAAPEVENADLYLTKDGAIIWNLSMSEYPISLNKGTTEGYGLLLKAKAPQTPTGVEQSEVSRQPSDIQKIIIDDNVFILRGGKMYDVTGKAVK